MDKNNQLIKFDIDFWRKHPDWFIEEFYGIKLFNYQKILLKGIINKGKWYISFLPRQYQLPLVQYLLLLTIDFNKKNKN